MVSLRSDASQSEYPEFAPHTQLTWRYQLLDTIGRGATAVVWSAWDVHLKRVVALKLIHPSEKHLDIGLFEREARLISALEHPHIVPMYDYGFSANTYYLATRYLTGGSLADKLVKGPLEPAEALRCMARIALALDYVHDRNILHRDLKPANILLDVQGMPYLADFGLAKPDVGQTDDNSISGTLYYMAPEQLIGRVGAASDVFAFGVVLYQILTGVLPFGGRQALGMAILANAETLPDVQAANPRLPAALNPLLHNLTHPDAAQRPLRVSSLLDEIAGILGVQDKLLVHGAAAIPIEPATNPAQHVADDALTILDNLHGEQLSLTKLMILDQYLDNHPHALSAAESTIILKSALYHNHAVGKWGHRWLKLSDQVLIIPRTLLLIQVIGRELTYGRGEAVRLLLWVALGSVIAFALQLYAVIIPNPVTADIRMLNAAGNGLLFGLPIGIGLFVGIHGMRRLRVPPFAAAGALSWFTSSLIIAVAFVVFARLFYLDSLDFGIALGSALLYSAGFVWAARLHPLIHGLLGVAGVAAGYLVPFALYAAEAVDRAPFIFGSDDPWASLPLVVFCALCLALFIDVPPLIRQRQQRQRTHAGLKTIQLPPPA